jgi:hypothetical protein
MAETSYEKYVVRKPIYETRMPISETSPKVKNRQIPTMTFMSSRQVAEANYYVEVGWIYGIPEPNPYIYEHVHEFDEIILHWGGDPNTPQDLGGEIEFYIGGQPIIFNTTTAMFIPKGTRHGPLTWKKFRFPHIEMSIMLGTGSAMESWGESGILEPKKELPRKTDKFDYEQYVVRSPMRETGGIFKKGRQAPTMTYMSRTQVNIAKCYIEFGWVWDIVEPSIPEMKHNNYDEIVLHIGGDPQNPEDLGADMEFGMGGKLLSFNTSYCAFIPKGLLHGPINWRNVRKPHIEMAIMLGAGTLKEGWEGSFINKPSPG